MISRGRKFFVKTESITFSNPKKRINWRPFFGLIILGFLIYQIVFSSSFKINNFIFEGIESTEIKETVTSDLQGKNILLIMPGRYLASLSKKYPALEEATVVRGLPHTIKVLAKERSQSLVWCNSAECYQVDSDGVAFKKIDKPADKVFINDLKDKSLQSGTKILSKSFVAFYLETLSQIPKKIEKQVKEAQVEETTFTISLLLDDNRKIILDTSQSLENQLFSLEQIFQTKKDEIKEYVDVRIPGTVYFK